MLPLAGMLFNVVAGLIVDKAQDLAHEHVEKMIDDILPDKAKKELDKLLSSFTSSIINELNNDELIDLSSLLELDDENLYKFNQGLSTTVTIKDNKVSKLFRKFKWTSRIQ